MTYSKNKLFKKLADIDKKEHAGNACTDYAMVLYKSLVYTKSVRSMTFTSTVYKCRFKIHYVHHIYWLVVF